MGEAKGQSRTKSDRERIIEWYKSDLERYKGMIGEYTEFNTLVTEKLINRVQERILELEKKEKDWNDTIRKLINED